jgi:hypothetical protein
VYSACCSKKPAPSRAIPHREPSAGDTQAYFGHIEASGPALCAEIARSRFTLFGRRTQVNPVIGASSKAHISSAGARLRWKWRRVGLNVSWARVVEGVANGLR